MATRIFRAAGRLTRTTFLLLALFSSASVLADGRLLGTGGATTLEGAAGGGLVPWATLAGYGTKNEMGLTGTATAVRSDDYDMSVLGIGWTWRNRVELSLARQEFDIGALSGALGISPDASLRQDIVGVKVRVLGDLIYGRGPQVSFGLQYKRHLDYAIPEIAGSRDDAGLDLYVSASRLLLAGPLGRSLLVSGTLRTTSANQLGLMGFGGDLGERTLVAEASAALMLSRKSAIGVEYRQKPNNLSFAREDDWYNIFGAYFVNKRLTVVAAYNRLGDIATLRDQRGIYLSVQGSY